jgi:hypothetical protein
LETRKGWVQRDFSIAVLANGIVDLDTFGSSSLVVPKDRWPDHFAGTIQENGSVHLAAQSDRVRIRLSDLLDARKDTVPPIFWALLRPKRFWGRERIFGGCLSKHVPVPIYKNHLAP